MRVGGIRGQRLAKAAVEHVFTEFLSVGDFSELGRRDSELFENGGRVILPDDCLMKLVNLKIFDRGDREALHLRIHGPRPQIPAFVGVLDFTGHKDKIYIPRWLQEYCGLSVGDSVCVIDAKLPKGTFMKIQAQSTDFLEIEDPASTLTAIFPNFSCVAAGQYLRFLYQGKPYDIRIQETLPEKAVSLINTNITVDFAEPVGYAEYAQRERERREEEASSVLSAGRASATSRPGRTLDGRAAAPRPPDDWDSDSRTASRKDLGRPLAQVIKEAAPSGSDNSRSTVSGASSEPRPNLDVRRALAKEGFRGKGRRL